MNEKNSDFFGVDSGLALEFAGNDEQKLAENLGLFLIKYGNSEKLSVKSYGSNRRAVLRLIRQIKRDSRLCGAYALCKICDDVLAKKNTAPKDIADITANIERVKAYIEVILPSRTRLRDAFSQLLSELELAVGCGLEENVGLTVKRLSTSADTPEKRSTCKAVEEAVQMRDMTGIAEIINSFKKCRM